MSNQSVSAGLMRLLIFSVARQNFKRNKNANFYETADSVYLKIQKIGLDDFDMVERRFFECYAHR